MGIQERKAQVMTDARRIASIDKRLVKIKKESRDLKDERTTLEEKWEKIDQPALPMGD